METFLPWFGLVIPVLLAGALWRRSAAANPDPAGTARDLVASGADLLACRR